MLPSVESVYLGRTLVTFGSRMQTCPMHTYMWRICLSRTFLEPTLEYANLVGANLSHANLIGANLSGAKFIDQGRRPVKGPTQAQLDMAYADPANPPKLQGVVDAETDEPVVWRGKPLHSDA